MSDNRKAPRDRKMKVPRDLINAKRARVTDQLALLSTEQLQSLIAEDMDHFRRETARQILTQRNGASSPTKSRRQSTRMTRRRFQRAASSDIANLDVHQLPSGATKYLNKWLDRFDDSQLQFLTCEAKSPAVRDAAQALLMSRRNYRYIQSLMAKFSQCSIDELQQVVDQHEEGSQVACDILINKVYETLKDLPTDELRQIMNQGGAATFSRIAREIYSSRRQAPGTGDDWWREQV